MSTTIQIEGLTKHFPSPGGGVTTAVDAVSLTINAGELFFLLGPSGCGKTTLLRMVAGFIEPTRGSIVFDEPGTRRDVTFLAPNLRNTGMVFQSYALWPHLTVFENVAFGLRVRKVAPAELSHRVMEALASVQMHDYAPRRPNQLSGGQQQRIALARALVVRPSVLLLDEPLSNLDAKLRNDLRSEIRRICKASGTTGVYVTHDQKEALSMADRIAIMQAGSIIQIGTPEQMYKRPANRFVAEFLGETNLLPATVATLARDHATLDSPAGTIVSTAFPQQLAQGAKVLVSLRPESIRPAGADAANALRARLIDTTFLGETAQHTLELAGGSRVKFTQLHPLAQPLRELAAVSVDPADAVVLPG